ncbi:hypothetical protein ACFL0U_04490, partial [Pseudomonadota bacterium]
HNEALTSGSNENDSTCTDSSGYNTSLGDVGCILGTSLEEKEIVFDPTFLASNPGFGEGTGGSGDGTNCLLSDPSVYNITAWTGGTAGDYIDNGNSVTGDACVSGYSSAGTPTLTCTNGAWEAMVDPCTATCTTPLEDATGYENITAWTNITAEPDEAVVFDEEIDSGVTIEGTCRTGYIGGAYGAEVVPETTCTDGVLSAVTSTCVPNITSTGMTLWLDAEDIDGDGDTTDNPSNGSNISTWSDKSGSGNDASQGNATYQPLFVENVKNNRSVIRYSLDYMTSSLNMNSYSNITILAVYRMDGSISTTTCLFGQDDGGYDRTFYTYLSGDAKLGTGNGGVITISDFSPQDTWYLFTVIYNDASSVVYKGDVLSESFTALAPSGTDYTAIGAAATDLFNFQGDLAEVIMYDRAVSDTERQEVEAYLQNKWGI